MLRGAHRGASGLAPENTLAAFHLALKQEADILECDVHLSRDGVPVVLHDDTLDRTTTGRGPVAALAWERISQLDAGSWFHPRFRDERVPRLGDLLDLAKGRAMVNLELKSAGAVNDLVVTVAREIRTHAAEGRVVISSFDVDALRTMAAVAPRLPRAVLYAHGVRRAERAARRLTAWALHPRHTLCSPSLLARARRMGMRVLTWTVDDRARIHQLARMGVDGLFSNYPLRVPKAPGTIPKL